MLHKSCDKGRDLWVIHGGCNGTCRLLLPPLLPLLLVQLLCCSPDTGQTVWKTGSIRVSACCLPPWLYGRVCDMHAVMTADQPDMRTVRKFTNCVFIALLQGPDMASAPGGDDCYLDTVVPCIRRARMGSTVPGTVA